MNLVFPKEILNQHLVVLGKTGAGKSSALRHIVENLLSRGKRVCIIDPKGDWWGLKSSADGKGPGYPVIAFGDFKEAKVSDVPINEGSGRHVAELITSGNRPCIIGFRGWMTSHMVRFWIDFAAGIFNANSGELYLVGDEFHNFAPKGKIMDPEAGKCLHWSNRLMSEGRGLGIVCLIASQRPQKVHNDTLTSCETLVAMRVIHKSDRDAVKDWIEGCGDMEKGKGVLNSLASMERGEAFVWSPEVEFGPKALHFPMFETFDSFAPPQLQKKVASESWASVDLEAVKAKLSKVIDEHKANDPAELKQIIAELKRKLHSAEQSKPEVQQKAEIVERPIFDEKSEVLFDMVDASLKTATEGFQAASGAIQYAAENLGTIRNSISVLVKNADNQALDRAKPALFKEVRKIISPRPQSSNGKLPIGEEKVLRALIQFPEGLRREQLTVLTGYKRSSRDSYIARLKEKGFVEANGDSVLATEEGVAALPNAEPLPVGDDLKQYWRMRLPQGELAILEELIRSYPDSVSRDALCSTTGYQRSSRDSYIARLRAKELLTEPSRGEVRASDTLFS